LINLFSQKIIKVLPNNQNQHFIEFGQTLGSNLSVKNIPYGPMLKDAIQGTSAHQPKIDEKV